MKIGHSNPISNHSLTQGTCPEWIQELQLEQQEISEASELLSKIPSSEKVEVIQHVMTLKKMQMKKHGTPLSSLKLLEAVITRMDTPDQRSEVVLAIFELFKTGVPGANEENVLDFLIAASKKNELKEVISLGNQFFFDFSDLNKNAAILEGSSSEKYFSIECEQSLKAASKEIEKGEIRQKLSLFSDKEQSIFEFVRKRMSPHQFQKALTLFLSVSPEERQDLISHVENLQKIRMRDDDDDGYPMSSIVALERLVNIPTAAKREYVMQMLLDLFMLGVQGAEESRVFDYLNDTPESMVKPILQIAKNAFFKYGNKEKNGEIISGTYKEKDEELCGYTIEHCFNVFKSISKLSGVDRFSEEQLKAFENLKISNELEDRDEEKRFIYKILFGNQESIRSFAFDLAKGNYHLFQWVKQLVNNTPLQLLLEQWEKDNERALEFKQSYETLQHMNKQIDQLYSSKNPSMYITNPNKPFPKNLIARHSSSNKTVRENTKKAMQCYLDTKFDSKGVKNINYVPESYVSSTFELKNDKYKLCGLNSSLIKNDEKQIHLEYDEWGIINNKLLSYIMKGNRFEGVSFERERDRYERPQKTKEFWEHWELLKSGEIYQNEIDPMIGSAVVTILQSKYWETNPVILDVGGGTGRLANSLLQSGSMDYILLEKNEKELEEAQRVLGNKAAIVPTDIVKDPLFYRDKEKTKPLEPCSVDIAIASGVLAKNVLKDRDEALIALKKICAAIKPQGFIIMTGLTDSHIIGSDLAEGFDLFNTSLPQSLRGLYIAQKK